MKLFAAGFAGVRGTGKTTFAQAVADKLRENYFLHADILPFAFPLKKQVFFSLQRKNDELYKRAKEYGVTDGENPFVKPYSQALRQLMRDLGAEQREKDPDYYIKEWLMGAVTQNHKYDLVLVDDVRFPNEKAFLQLLGPVFFLQREGIVSDGHFSETLLPEKGDRVIYLRDSLSDYRSYQQQVEEVAKEIFRSFTVIGSFSAV